MPVKITYFVHGTTLDNEKGIASGWAQGELSRLGEKQSQDLTKQVEHMRFDVVFCSDLKRAVDSAKLSFEEKYEIIPDKRLRECNYGDFTSKPEDFKDDMKRYISEPFPNGESYKDVGKRMRNFVVFLKKNYNGKHVAIVSHQAPQLALEVIVNGKTWEQAIDEDWRKIGKWQPGWEYNI